MRIDGETLLLPGIFLTLAIFLFIAQIKFYFIFMNIYVGYIMLMIALVCCAPMFKKDETFEGFK